MSENQIQEIITGVATALEPRFANIDGRLGGIDDHLAGIKHRLDTIESRLDGVERRLDGVEHRLDGVERRLGLVETDVKDLKYRMVSLEETMDDVLVEQRLIRHSMVSNLNDMMHLKDRLAAQAA
jgi:archaellum component FlaC